MSNWISCEEREPDPNIDVLCYDEKDDEQYVAQISFGRWSILSGVHIVHDQYDCEPTHWQPLPEPPTKTPRNI